MTWFRLNSIHYIYMQAERECVCVCVPTKPGSLYMWVQRRLPRWAHMSVSLDPYVRYMYKSHPSIGRTPLTLMQNVATFTPEIMVHCKCGLLGGGGNLLQLFTCMRLGNRGLEYGMVPQTAVFLSCRDHFQGSPTMKMFVYKLLLCRNVTTLAVRACRFLWGHGQSYAKSLVIRSIIRCKSQ